MGFTITKDTLSGSVQRIRQRFPEVTANALYDELREVEFPETQERVPVRFGDLKSTGRVPLPEIRGNTVTGRIVYGGIGQSGKLVDYAMVVHEDLEAHHPHGEAKYVSSVLNESSSYMRSRLATRMHFSNWAFD